MQCAVSQMCVKPNLGLTTAKETTVGKNKMSLAEKMTGFRRTENNKIFTPSNISLCLFIQHKLLKTCCYTSLDKLTNSKYKSFLAKIVANTQK